MNILHVGNIRNSRLNGVCIVVPRHIEHQAKYENVALFNLDTHIPVVSKGKYPVFNRKEFNCKIKNLPTPFNKPDLVVFHEVYWPAFIGLSANLRRRNIPYIIIPHCSLTQVAQNTKTIKKFLGNLVLFNTFIHNAKAIHYLSSFEKNSSKFWNINTFISGNGMDVPVVKKTVFTNKGLKLIYVGRIDIKQKGLDILIESAAYIRQEMLDNDISITIAGPDHENNKSRLQKKIEYYGLAKVVRIEKAVFGEAKIEKIISHDCFIQLSRNEGQPMGMLEAMSLGMPTIATSGTSLMEVIRDQKLGFAVPDDPRSIAETIIKINKNKGQLNKKSTRSIKYININHNWNIIALNTIDLYKKYVGG